MNIILKNRLKLTSRKTTPILRWRLFVCQWLNPSSSHGEDEEGERGGVQQKSDRRVASVFGREWWEEHPPATLSIERVLLIGKYKYGWTIGLKWTATLHWSCDGMLSEIYGTFQVTFIQHRLQGFFWPMRWSILENGMVPLCDWPRMVLLIMRTTNYWTTCIEWGSDLFEGNWVKRDTASFWLW